MSEMAHAIESLDMCFAKQCLLYVRCGISQGNLPLVIYHATLHECRPAGVSASHQRPGVGDSPQLESLSCSFVNMELKQEQ
jgi:hypothetical protein